MSTVGSGSAARGPGRCGSGGRCAARRAAVRAGVVAASGLATGESPRARLRRGRGGRALGPHGSVAGPRLLPGVRGCVMGGGGGLASCRVRRKVFNMAAGAPGPLCGGGVGREQPSPERPTLRTRVPHHHLVPRPPGVPGPGWGRGRPAPLGEGRSRGSGLERLGGWGHNCRGGHFGDCGAGQRCPDARPPARPGGRSSTAFGPDGAAPRGGLARTEGQTGCVCRRDVRRGPQPPPTRPSSGGSGASSLGGCEGWGVPRSQP